MKLFNTITREKEEFIIKDATVRMYVCGPTVYNLFHIGNARCFTVFDMLRRYLEYRGNKVVYVQNFTDVDDKLINRAVAENTTVKELSDRYIKEYYTDAHGLGIHDATFHPRATENIANIISLVQKLIENGHAYVVGNDVYFDSRSFSEYGKLSHYNLEELEAGSRVDISEDKRHPFDFALWKGRKTEDEIAWESPWGMGRPGWHIECSAMVNRYLGTEIDIHGGGIDLVFPHHENEIAQSECATGCTLARFWLHNGHINVDNKKMSKSEGNFFLVRDAAAKYSYQAIRFFLLSSHYRSPINYSDDILRSSQAALERLYNCAESISFRSQNAGNAALSQDEATSLEYIKSKKEQFIEAMDDDFNTADAIGYLFEITKEINTRLIDANTTAEYIKKSGDIFIELTNLLGFEKQAVASDDTDYIEDMIKQRADAKKAKDFAKADSIRDELKSKGIVLEDTPQGVKWKRA